MTKQEFAFKLLTFFMPYPLSRMLPRLLRRLFVGLPIFPPGWTPDDPFPPGVTIEPGVVFPPGWTPDDPLPPGVTVEPLPAVALEKLAAPFLSVLSHVADGVVSYSNDLLNSLYQITPPDLQPDEIIVDLSSALETAVDDLTEFLDDIDAAERFVRAPRRFHHHSSVYIKAVYDRLAALVAVLPPDVIPPPPPYTPPLPPIYTGPPVPGPTGPTSSPVTRRGLKAIWFKDSFEIIDPAIWTIYKQLGANATIVGDKLKETAAQVGGLVWILSADDDTIPASFDVEFELKFSSGTGTFLVQVHSGVHRIMVYFLPNNILAFRQKDPDGYKEIDVGNFMGLTYTWKIVYNGTTCDIYRNGDLIDSGLYPYVDTGHKGRRQIWGQNVFAIFLDDFTITEN